MHNKELESKAWSPLGQKQLHGPLRAERATEALICAERTNLVAFYALGNAARNWKFLRFVCCPLSSPVALALFSTIHSGLVLRSLDKHISPRTREIWSLRLCLTLSGAGCHMEPVALACCRKLLNQSSSSRDSMIETKRSFNPPCQSMPCTFSWELPPGVSYGGACQ